ncbi:phosphodiester glycosidase family protein [Streptomyces xiamenensis]|uniref:phosphodiester glycosidase family protein n=1 Tax=Streptomyces xiamenensis TaxID=408015 RepID=UPI0036E6FC6B
MRTPTAAARRAEDREAIRILRAHGYNVPDVQALARDQRAFAIRATNRDLMLAPGAHLRSRCVDLGAGSFTNVHTLTLHLKAVRAEVHSRPDPFHLPELVSGSVLAAVSGSFAFISDDPSYQPAEPCLDFCCRNGTVISPPTAGKPGLLVRDGQPVIESLPARGTLALGGRPHRWIGSKEPGILPGPDAPLLIYGAANCEIRYHDHPRTGFLRHVDRPSNVTPLSPSAVDYVVAGSPGHGLWVSEIRPGGGSDLFSGNFILRADRPLADVTPGAPVEFTEVGGHQVGALDSGISLGPSVADAANGNTPAYDTSLGKSPFRNSRHARTLIALHEGQLVLQILDGAPHTDTFRGATPQETAELCTADGLDPHHVYHLDGGASSKIAYRHASTPGVVGSMHYLRWPSTPTEPFRWQGREGRALHSAIILKPRSREVHRCD